MISVDYDSRVYKGNVSLGMEREGPLRGGEGKAPYNERDCPGDISS